MKKLPYFSIIILLITMACTKDIPIDPIQNDLVQDVFEGVLEDSFNSKGVVLYANSSLGLIVAFDRKLSDGSLETFSKSSLEFPDVFISSDNTVWNIFGEATSGPREGQQLKTVNSQIGYWFSFATLYPKITLMGEAPQDRILDDFSNPEWLINPTEVISGAIKDGIPAISTPNYIQLNSSNCTNDYYVNNDELVTVIKNGNNLKVYPHKVLVWHEIVNDEINGVPISLSFCPLTGTSDAWERTLNGKITTFGVSGFLYNNNLILYDRETDSLWPQILKLSVNGESKNLQAKRVQVAEMTWAAAKNISCELLLLSNHTGFQRDYNFYPYGNYRSSEALLFPISFTDYRIPIKERVLNILIDDKSKSYRFKDFSQ